VRRDSTDKNGSSQANRGGSDCEVHPTTSHDYAAACDRVPGSGST
jgi:hypothetical protein